MAGIHLDPLPDSACLDAGSLINNDPAGMFDKLIISFERDTVEDLYLVPFTGGITLRSIFTLKYGLAKWSASLFTTNPPFAPSRRREEPLPCHNTRYYLKNTMDGAYEMQIAGNTATTKVKLESERSKSLTNETMIVEW